jgi:hypothetical protein
MPVERLLAWRRSSASRKLRPAERRHADLLDGVLDESELAQADDEATPERLTDFLLSDSEDFDEENSLAEGNEER